MSGFSIVDLGKSAFQLVFRGLSRSWEPADQMNTNIDFEENVFSPEKEVQTLVRQYGTITLETLDLDQRAAATVLVSAGRLRAKGNDYGLTDLF